MRVRHLVGSAITALALLLSSMAIAEGGGSGVHWGTIRLDRFGISLMAPMGTEGVAVDYGNGWGGLELTGPRGQAHVYAVAKLGVQATSAEMQAAVERATSIPASAWNKVHEGIAVNGWKWYRRYQANDPKTGKMLDVLIGTGKRGSYAIFLSTTAVDYTANRPLYEKWHRNITLF